MDMEVCQGFMADDVKAAHRNINQTKAAEPDKIHPRFLHHLGPVFNFLLTSIFNKSWEETIVPKNGDYPASGLSRKREGNKEDGELQTYVPHIDCRKNDGASGHQTSTIFC